MNNNSNITYNINTHDMTPVRPENLKVGERYYIEDRLFANDPDTDEPIIRRGVVLSIKREGAGGVWKAEIRLDNGTITTLVATNYLFFSDPRDWKEEYAPAAKNAATVAAAKAPFREAAYGVAAAKRLALPYNVKGKVASFLSGVNANLPTQREVLHTQIAAIKKRSRRTLRRRRDATRRRRYTRARK